MKVTKANVACVQLTSRGDLHANLATCAALLGEAKERGAELGLLPENFALVGDNEQAKFAIAETLDEKQPGPILGALKAMAAKHGLWLIGGGMPEKSNSVDHVHNTAVVLEPDGRLVATYRKMHLFDVDIPDGAQFCESRTVRPGDGPGIVDTPWGRIGLSICYDLRFPELYRLLASQGARILIVPAAFTLHTGKDHWRPLLRARAIENQAYVLAAGQFGRHNARRVTYGHSMIVDPWGTVLAEAPDRECVIVAEVDFAFQDLVRKELPCLRHRRL